MRTQASGFFREDFHHFCDESILICTELLASTGVHTPPYLAMKHTVSKLVSVPTTQEHPVSGHSPGHRGLKSHDELDSARASRLDAEGDLRDLDGWRDFLILFDIFWRVLMAFGGISGHWTLLDFALVVLGKSSFQNQSHRFLSVGYCLPKDMSYFIIFGVIVLNTVVS